MDLKESISAVCDSLVKASMDEAKDKHNGLIQKLKANPLIDWDDPSVVDCMHLFEQRKVIQIILEEKYPNAGDKLWKIVTLYNHYNYIGNQLRSIVDMGEGCVADKTRWVMKQAIKWYNGENCDNLPSRKDANHKYWHPDFGDTSMWLKYVDILIDSYYRGIDKDCLHFIEEMLEEKNKTEKQIKEENKILNNVYKEILSMKEEFASIDSSILKESIISTIMENKEAIFCGGITKYQLIGTIKSKSNKKE